MKIRKKLMLAAAVFLFTGVVNEVSALGIGVQGNFNSVGYSLYPSITFKLSSPWVFAVNGSIRDDRFTLGVTADNWIVEQPLGGPLSFFFGWGLYGDLSLGDPVWIGGGLRIPIGLRLLVLNDVLEFYLQVAPQLGLQNHDSLIAWNVPVAIGFRIWLRDAQK